VVGWLVVIVFIREPPGFREAGPRSAPAVPGMSASEAARGSWRFWLLAVVFFLGDITINGTLAHVVALLRRTRFPGCFVATLLAMTE
jgi:hypothetical protein